jgi:hypothetical protein
VGLIGAALNDDMTTALLLIRDVCHDKPAGRLSSFSLDKKAWARIRRSNAEGMG